MEEEFYDLTGSTGNSSNLRTKIHFSILQQAKPEPEPALINQISPNSIPLPMQMDSPTLNTLNRPSTFLHNPKPFKFVQTKLFFFNPRISSPVHLRQTHKFFSGVVCGVSSTETRLF